MQFQQSNTDTQDRKLFIGGLNHDTIERTLQGYFEQWGEVVDCVIMKDGMGRSRGFGFITYKEPYQLQNAQRNGVHVIDNKEVDAKVAVPKDHEEIDTNRDQFRKLFIGGLNYETTFTGLRDYFAQFGEIVECNVMKDGEGRSRGFGFVTYSDVSGLNLAQSRRPHTIDGKEVDTKRAMPRDSADNNMTVKKMFVGGLKEDTTEEMIRQVFSEYGHIEEVDILKDKSNGRPRGFCFVLFSDYDSVDRAVLKKRHNLNGCSVEVRKAVGKDQMASRGSGPPSRGGFDGPRNRWNNGPQRNFPNGGGRYDRGGGDGFNNFRGRGGYNNNFGGPPGGGRGGYNNFGDSGNSGNFGGYNNNFSSGGGSGGGNYNGSGSGNGFNNFSGSSGGGGGFNNSSGGFGFNNSSGSSGFNNFGGSFGNGDFDNYGGSSGGGTGGNYQQQNWSGTGGYNDNSGGWGGNSGGSGGGGWGGNSGGSGGGGFGNNYNNDYSGGPLKSNSGFAARGQGPYGGGYGAGGGSSGGTGSNRGGNNSGSSWR